VKTRYRNLREFLDDTGTTQVELAKLVGTGQSTISKVINGHGVSFALALRIARIARIPVESLAPPSDEAVAS
jgi:plasmid maintenance system antidote protein VapI